MASPTNYARPSRKASEVARRTIHQQYKDPFLVRNLGFNPFADNDVTSLKQREPQERQYLKENQDHPNGTENSDSEFLDSNEDRSDIDLGPTTLTKRQKTPIMDVTRSGSSMDENELLVEECQRQVEAYRRACHTVDQLLLAEEAQTNPVEEEQLANILFNEAVTVETNTHRAEREQTPLMEELKQHRTVVEQIREALNAGQKRCASRLNEKNKSKKNVKRQKLNRRKSPSKGFFQKRKVKRDSRSQSLQRPKVSASDRRRDREMNARDRIQDYVHLFQFYSSSHHQQDFIRVAAKSFKRLQLIRPSAAVKLLQPKLIEVQDHSIEEVQVTSILAQYHVDILKRRGPRKKRERVTMSVKKSLSSMLARHTRRRNQSASRHQPKKLPRNIRNQVQARPLASGVKPILRIQPVQRGKGSNVDTEENEDAFGTQRLHDSPKRWRNNGRQKTLDSQNDFLNNVNNENEDQHDVELPSGRSGRSKGRKSRVPRKRQYTVNESRDFMQTKLTSFIPLSADDPHKVPMQENVNRVVFEDISLDLRNNYLPLDYKTMFHLTSDTDRHLWAYLDDSIQIEMIRSFRKLTLDLVTMTSAKASLLVALWRRWQHEIGILSAVLAKVCNSDREKLIAQLQFLDDELTSPALSRQLTTETSTLLSLLRFVTKLTYSNDWKEDQNKQLVSELFQTTLELIHNDINSDTHQEQHSCKGKANIRWKLMIDCWLELGLRMSSDWQQDSIQTTLLYPEQLEDVKGLLAHLRTYHLILALFAFNLGLKMSVPSRLLLFLDHSKTILKRALCRERDKIINCLLSFCSFLNELISDSDLSVIEVVFKILHAINFEFDMDAYFNDMIEFDSSIVRPISSSQSFFNFLNMVVLKFCGMGYPLHKYQAGTTREQELALKKITSKLLLGYLPRKPLSFQETTSEDLTIIGFRNVLALLNFFIGLAPDKSKKTFILYLERTLDFQNCTEVCAQSWYIRSLVNILKLAKDIQIEKLVRLLCSCINHLANLYVTDEARSSYSPAPNGLSKKINSYFLQQKRSTDSEYVIRQRQKERLACCSQSIQALKEIANSRKSTLFESLPIFINSDWTCFLSTSFNYPSPLRLAAASFLQSVLEIRRYLLDWSKKPSFSINNVSTTQRLGVESHVTEDIQHSNDLDDEMDFGIDDSLLMQIDLTQARANAIESVQEDDVKLRQNLLDVCKQISQRLGHVIKFLDEIVQAHFKNSEPRSGGLNDDLYIAAIDAIADLCQMFFEDGKRSWKDLMSSYGPDAFWATASKYRFDPCNRFRNLKIMLKLLEINNLLPNEYGECFYRIWFEASFDSLLENPNKMGLQFQSDWLIYSTLLFTSPNRPHIFNVQVSLESLNSRTTRTALIKDILRLMNETFLSETMARRKEIRSWFLLSMSNIPQIIKICLTECNASFIDTYVDYIYEIAGMMLAFNADLLYHKDDPRPFLLDFGELFCNEKLVGAKKWTKHRINLTCRLLRGLGSLDFAEDVRLQKAIRLQLQTYVEQMSGVKESFQMEETFISIFVSSALSESSIDRHHFLFVNYFIQMYIHWYLNRIDVQPSWTLTALRIMCYLIAGMQKDKLNPSLFLRSFEVITKALAEVASVLQVLCLHIKLINILHRSIHLSIFFTGTKTSTVLTRYLTWFYYYTIRLWAFSLLSLARLGGTSIQLDLLRWADIICGEKMQYLHRDFVEAVDESARIHFYSGTQQYCFEVFSDQMDSTVQVTTIIEELDERSLKRAELLKSIVTATFAFWKTSLVYRSKEYRPLVQELLPDVHRIMMHMKHADTSQLYKDFLLTLGPVGYPYICHRILENI